jgi:hypothetical protein
MGVVEPLQHCVAARAAQPGLLVMRSDIARRRLTASWRSVEKSNCEEGIRLRVARREQLMDILHQLVAMALSITSVRRTTREVRR